MKYLILIFALAFFTDCKSQMNTNRKVVNSESTLSFKNQGEQEDYWAKRFFENNYEKSEYPKYNGEIIINHSKILYNDTQHIEYSVSEPKYKLIFEKGLLYPDVIFLNARIRTEFPQRGKRKRDKNTEQMYRDTLVSINAINYNHKICCLEELTFLSDNPQIKRFSFWLFSGSMNPSVYLFELTNEKANKETNWESFIENAKLTFIEYGWLIL